VSGFDHIWRTTSPAVPCKTLQLRRRQPPPARDWPRYSQRLLIEPLSNPFIRSAQWRVTRSAFAET
jgi:hypothetical protein